MLVITRSCLLLLLDWRCSNTASPVWLSSWVGLTSWMLRIHDRQKSSWVRQQSFTAIFARARPSQIAASLRSRGLLLREEHLIRLVNRELARRLELPHVVWSIRRGVLLISVDHWVKLPTTISIVQTARGCLEFTIRSLIINEYLLIKVVLVLDLAARWNTQRWLLAHDGESCATWLWILIQKRGHIQLSLLRDNHALLTSDSSLEILTLSILSNSKFPIASGLLISTIIALKLFKFEDIASRIVTWILLDEQRVRRKTAHTVKVKFFQGLDVVIQSLLK